MKRNLPFAIGLACVLLALLFGLAPAAEETTAAWARESTFGGKKVDQGRCNTRTSDGGHVLTGHTRSFGSGNDVYLIRLDPGGEMEWQTTLGQGWGYDARQTSDGGFIVAATIPSYSNILRDICLMKADAAGGLEWQRALGGGYGYSVTQTPDLGYAVTGYSTTGGADEEDVCLVRTDSTGQKLWTQIYGGTGSDRGYCIQGTDDGGFVVAGVTGSYGAGSTDVLLLKIDSQGNLTWQRTFGGASADEGHWVQRTADGGYIVAGTTRSSGAGSKDVLLIKTDSRGHMVWQQTFGGTESDEAWSVRQTPDGGYIVAGTTSSMGAGDCDAYVIRADSGGSLLWQTTFGGSGVDEAYSVSLGESGGFMIAGTTGSIGAGVTDVYLIAISADPELAPTPAPTTTPELDASIITANQAWVVRYNGPANEYDYGSAVAVDGSGEVYVAGHSWSSTTGRDFATVKYDSDGTQLWVARYDGPASGQDYADAITLDGAGNAYVTGHSQGIATSRDCATVKYDANGDELWASRYDGPASGDDIAQALAVDATGNVYITGYSEGSDSGYGCVTVKYDSAGNEIWAARYDGPTGGDDYANAIAVDGVGNVWITGSTSTAVGATEYVTLMYDSSGNLIWASRYGGPTSGHNGAQALALDVSSDICVTGFSQVNGKGRDYATIKYDVFGNQLWAAKYDGPAGSEDVPMAIAVDEFRNVYVTGYSQGKGSSRDYATVKYDSDGNLKWVARYNGPANADDTAIALAVDSIGHVCVTGYSADGDALLDFATVKYDGAGNQLWAARYNGPGSGNDYAQALGIDQARNIYVAGYSEADGTAQDYTTLKYSLLPTPTPTPTPTPAPAPTPTPPPGNTSTPSRESLAGMMTSGGLLLQYVELVTPDGLGWLELLTGTTALDAAGNALGYVEAGDVHDPPSPVPGLQVIGTVYDFGPDGANFNPALTLGIEYHPDSLPEGVAEDALAIARYDPDAQKWVKLESRVDLQNHWVLAEIDHFTLVAIVSSAGSGSGFNFIPIVGGIGGFLAVVALLFRLNAKGEQRLREKGEIVDD